MRFKKRKKGRKREKKEHPSSQEKRQVVLCFSLSLSFSVSHSLTFFPPSLALTFLTLQLSHFLPSPVWHGREQWPVAMSRRGKEEGKGFSRKLLLFLSTPPSLAASHSRVRYHQTKKTAKNGFIWKLMSG